MLVLMVRIHQLSAKLMSSRLHRYLETEQDQSLLSMSRALRHLDKPSLLPKPVSPIVYVDRLHQLMRDHFSFSVGSGQNLRKGYLSGWPCSQEGQLKCVPETLGDFRTQSVSAGGTAHCALSRWSLGGMQRLLVPLLYPVCAASPHTSRYNGIYLLLLQTPYTLNLHCARRIHIESSSHS